MEKELKKLKLSQLEKLACEKHGRRAYAIVLQYGSDRQKDAWIKTIQQDRDVSAEARHSVWQQELRQKFSFLPDLED